MSKKHKKIPFDFVLDLLYPLEVEIRPMFGCYSLYTDGKLVLFLRNREKEPEKNGVWVVAGSEDYESLAEEIGVWVDDKLRNANRKWILIGSSNEEFESRVTNACALISAGDPRVGRVG